jgi:hypothetical protein
MLSVLHKIIKDKEATKEQKYKAQLMIDSEMFSKLEDEVDKVIEDKINKFIDDEIEKSIKRGTLPKGKKFRNIKKVIKNDKL